MNGAPARGRDCWHVPKGGVPAKLEEPGTRTGTIPVTGAVPHGASPRPGGRPRRRIGYHASHEQTPPEELLRLVQRAEAAGFDAVLSSDHLAPWGVAQGHAGHAWSWLGAALAATTLPFGVVTAPGQRYHPVVTAQAVATLSRMFPGRFWAAYGSGEALNEHVTGDAWPSHEERRQRLRSSVQIIRALLAGETVSADDPVRVHEARIWSRPAQPPPVIAAAVSEQTAAWAAGWAEGLITVGSDPQQTAAVLEAYRGRGGRGEAMLQIHVSLARTDEEALRIAQEQWRQATVPAEQMWDLEHPEHFDARSDPRPEAMRGAVAISSSPRLLADRIAEAARGFDQVHIHHVGLDQDAFLDQAPELLGALRERLHAAAAPPEPGRPPQEHG
ncbi:TIGR03885 family FMN-dependent LLM class oxidoreductase [Brachybacterium phenoliresistens]|uniref:TIGR03885 family FMN-dependent LLM class oxidoreductase n=1 Tax=Brachybacterium phenoliresistens TaxID=396014 RepID=UPI0031D03D24